MSREARQRVAFRPGTRIGVIAASLAAAAALVLPTTALAATTSIGSAQGNQTCNLAAGADTVQAATAPGRPSYAVPAGATSITSWNIQAYPGDSGPVALEIWRPAGPPVYNLVFISDPQTVTPGATNSFPLASPVTVQAGDLIGLRLEITSVWTCEFKGVQGDAVGFSGSELPPVAGATATLSPIGLGEELNIAAVVEVTAPPNPNPVPTTADQCKDGGWQALTDNAGTPFKNQGDCVSFVATGGTNTAAGS